jgi:hypothetical protein
MGSGVRFARFTVTPPRQNGGVLEGLTAEVDELAAVDPSVLADSASVVALHRLSARIEAIAARASARWDANSEWSGDGARSGAAWLAARTHGPKSDAQRCLRRGRALRELPVAGDAWLAGSISGAHVSALAASRGTELLAKAMERDEQQLIEVARSHSFVQFQRRLSYWRQANDPDEEDGRHRREHDDRRVHLSQTFQGAWVLDGVLDRVGGSIVAETLKGIEHELFQQDWADAKRRLGRDPLVHELDRTPAQRRADALVEMATRARTAPLGGRRPEPLFSILIGLPGFTQLCELANGTVVTPRALVPWLTKAWIERVVFETPSRVLDVGVQRRLFTGATRRAVELRDRTCFHDTCDEPVEQIDHIQPWAWGGPTTQDNGRGACGFHNRDRHRRDDEPP